MLRRSNLGFNLIEVLIALVILSVGLLGIAALQIAGIRGTQGSLYRSQATALMNEMAERMYVNLPGVRTGNYNGIDSGATGSGIDCTAAPPSQCAVENGVTVATCTAAQMASYDGEVLFCGYRNGGVRSGGIKDLLPGGRLRVTCNNSGSPSACYNGSTYTITVSWVDRGDTSTDSSNTLVNFFAGQSVSMTVQP